jgi:poly-gamma-glutamate capsule biosynthesis protein CapA/YwtB (metallophosphatase superfamily)
MKASRLYISAGLVYLCVLTAGTLLATFSALTQQQPQGNASLEPNFVPVETSDTSSELKPAASGTSTVCLTGDSNLGTMNEFFDRELYVYEGVHETLQECDLLVVNLETNISDVATGNPAPKGYHFKAYPSSIQTQLIRLGVDAAILANNHTMDYGPAAFTEQMDLLNAAGILQVGGGVNIDDAFTPRYVEVNGTTIAMLAFNSIENYVTDVGANTAGSAYFDLDRSLAAIRAARENADIVTVYAHWGLENSTVVNEWQRSWARMFIDAGADIVWASGPHVQQEEETYAGKPIFYAIGNFAVAGFSWLPGGTNGTIVKLKIQNDAIQEIGRQPVILDPNGWPY